MDVKDFAESNFIYISALYFEPMKGTNRVKTPRW